MATVVTIFSVSVIHGIRVAEPQSVRSRNALDFANEHAVLEERARGLTPPAVRRQRREQRG